MMKSTLTVEQAKDYREELICKIELLLNDFTKKTALVVDCVDSEVIGLSNSGACYSVSVDVVLK